MIRVAHFIHDDAPGGGPKVVRQLLEGLPEFHQVLIHGGHRSLSAWCRSEGIETIHVPTEHLLLSWVRLPALVRGLRQARAEVVVLHGQWAGPLGAIACRLAGVPAIVYVAHHPSFYHSTALWRAIRNYAAEIVPCRMCDVLVTLSEGNRYNYLYRGWVDESRMRLVHNGVDPEDLPTTSEIERFRKDEGMEGPPARHAVFVGRVDDQKRVDWLLAAWDVACSVRSAGAPPWHLWIIGHGRDFASIERLARASANARSIHLVGSRANGMLGIAAADLVVMSSLYEGHALVPLEAMACSKPIVSFATDGVSDSVVHGETGLLSALGDTQALGRDIARVLGDPDLGGRLGTAGRARLLSNFPLQKTLRAYSSIITSLAEARRGGQPPAPPEGRHDAKATS